MYQKLILEEFPEIRFAHPYTTAHYDIAFPSCPGMMELTFFEKGAVTRVEGDGSRVEIPEGAFFFTTFDRPFRMFSEEAGCSHITVGVRGAFRLEAVSREEVGGWKGEGAAPAALLPRGPLVLGRDHGAAGLLRSLVNLYAVPGAPSALRCAGLFLELLAALTDEVLRRAMVEAGQVSPSGIRYAQRAARYLAEHLTEKLSVEAVAGELGISSSYLSALFKAYTGRSLVDYGNAIRVERIRELMVSRRLTLREAGEAVGIPDENYASRLFRKYAGISAREYLRQAGQEG